MRNESLSALARDVALPILLMLFTTVYLADGLSLGRVFRYGVPSAAFMPLVLSGVMYAALLAVIGARLREHLRSRRGARPATAVAPLSTLVRPALVVLATAAYIAVFVPIGFALSTVGYAYVLLALFGFRDGMSVTGQALRALAAVGICSVVYAFFVLAFGVQMPTLSGVI
jgi:putative tricarboxylic transport membrane protein